MTSVREKSPRVKSSSFVKVPPTSDFNGFSHNKIKYRIHILSYHAISINKIIQSACIRNNPYVKKIKNRLSKKTVAGFGIAATVAGLVDSRVI